MFQVPSKAMEIQGSPQFLFSESLEPSGNLRKCSNGSIQKLQQKPQPGRRSISDADQVKEGFQRR